jgi:hypothetical protein
MNASGRCLPGNKRCRLRGRQPRMPRALKRARGYVRTRVARPTALVTPPLCAAASLAALRLAERYELLGEVVRCNTGDERLAAATTTLTCSYTRSSGPLSVCDGSGIQTRFPDPWHLYRWCISHSVVQPGADPPRGRAPPKAWGRRQLVAETMQPPGSGGRGPEPKRRSSAPGVDWLVVERPTCEVDADVGLTVVSGGAEPRALLAAVQDEPLQVGTARSDGQTIPWMAHQSTNRRVRSSYHWTVLPLRFLASQRARNSSRSDWLPLHRSSNGVDHAASSHRGGRRLKTCPVLRRAEGRLFRCRAGGNTEKTCVVDAVCQASIVPFPRPPAARLGATPLVESPIQSRRRTGIEPAWELSPPHRF